MNGGNGCGQNFKEVFSGGSGRKGRGLGETGLLALVLFEKH